MQSTWYLEKTAARKVPGTLRLERDEGERAAPIEPFPWDGVSNLRLFSRFAKKVAVGVY